MKKLMTLVLVAMLVATLFAGCATTQTPAASEAAPAPAAEKTEQAAAPAAEEKTDKGVLKIGSSWSKKNDDLFIDLYNQFLKEVEAEAIARGYSGIEVIDVVSGDDVQKQASDIEDMITQQVDIILCYPYDKEAIKTSIAEAHSEGILFITYDRDVAEGGEQPDLWVGVDGVTQAYQSGMFMFNKMKEAGVEPNYIIEVIGDLSDMNVVNRMAGFEKAAKECGFEIAQVVPTDWTTDAAQEGFASAYAAHPETNCVILHSDWFGSSIQNILEPAGRWVGEDDANHVWIAATDGWPVGLPMIKDGLITCSASYDTIAMAKAAAPAILDMLDGTTQTNQAVKMPIDAIMLNAENVDAADVWGKK